MTTFTMQDLNNTEVTKEEEEVFKTMAEMGRVNVDLVGFNTPTQMGEPLPNQTPDISTIINNICTQLQLLSTVIKEGAGEGNSLNANETETKSLQDCVSATLEQAEWFKEMVEEKVAELFEDKDFDYEIEAAVNTWLNDFDFGDYVNVDEVVERVVEDKLNDATVSISF